MFRSIRAKLTLWYTIGFALVSIALISFIFLSFVGVLRAESDHKLLEMANNFSVAANAEQADAGPAARPTDSIVEAANEFRFRDYQFVIAASNGNIVAKTSEIVPPANEDLTDSNITDHSASGEEYRVVSRRLEIGGQAFRLYVFHPLAAQIALERRLRTVVIVTIPITLLFAGFGGYFLVRYSFKPIQQMSVRAALITSQNLEQRLPVANKDDELGNLAIVFNDLLDRLDKAFEQQRRFMADASHELRTPLAIVRGEAEVVLSKDNRQIEDYRESLSIVHDESKRLTRIVDDLFTLARADTGQFQTNFAPVYLDEIASEALRSMRVLADQKDIDLEFSADGDMPFSGDEPLLRRLFLNVLDNAVKYSPVRGKVSVECISAAGWQIFVTDDGPGIPADQHQHIFERFYRVDKARSRSNSPAAGGAGLGLSIAQWIAQIHGGTIRLTSSDQDGSVFSIEFLHANADGKLHDNER